MHEYMSATLIVSNIRLKNVHAMTCNKNDDSLVRKYAVSFLKKRKRKYAVSLLVLMGHLYI